MEEWRIFIATNYIGKKNRGGNCDLSGRATKNCDVHPLEAKMIGSQILIKRNVDFKFKQVSYLGVVFTKMLPSLSLSKKNASLGGICGKVHQLPRIPTKVKFCSLTSILARQRSL